jgi:hypothetical protein
MDDLRSRGIVGDAGNFSESHSPAIAQKQIGEQPEPVRAKTPAI